MRFAILSMPHDVFTVRLHHFSVEKSETKPPEPASYMLETLLYGRE